MPANQKVVPSSPMISSGSSDDPDKILPVSFKVKRVGFGGGRSTIVENDSLSSYSWPEETPRQPKVKGQFTSSTGALRDHEDKEEGRGNRQSNSASHEKGHVDIDLNNIKYPEPINDQSYVKAYMQLMYWTCISPFNPTKKLDGTGAESWFDWMLNILQKIPLVIITTFSLIQSVFEIKFYLLQHLSEPDLETFTDMCFFMMNGATKVYFLFLFTAQQGKLRKMLASIAKLHASPMHSSSMDKKINPSMKRAFILVTFSFLVNFILVIWEREIIGWTPERAILYHSKGLAKAVSIWTKDGHEDEELKSELVMKFGSNLTSTNFMLGITRMMIVFWSNIQMDTVTNIMLSNAETVKEEMKKFEQKIKDAKIDTEDITLEKFLSKDGDWAHYRLLKLTVNDNNDALDTLMRFKHVNNLMLFVYFAMNAFDGFFSLIYFLRLAYNMVLTSYTYRIASQASNLNDTGKKWILRLAWKSTDKPFQEKVPLILYELEKEPIGLGKGHFMIDESFIFRFLGSAGSVFVLQADARVPTVECERM